MAAPKKNLVDGTGKTSKPVTGAVKVATALKGTKNELTPGQLAALGIAGGLGAAAATLIGGAASAGVGKSGRPTKVR